VPPAALGLQQLRHSAGIRLAQGEALFGGEAAGGFDHLGVQLGVGRERDRLLLRRGVEDDFLFLHLLTVQRDGDGQQLFPAVGTNAVAEVHQLARRAGRAPLELALAAEELEVGIERPLLDHAFVGKVVQLLEQQQPDHAADRQRGPTLVLVEFGEGALELCPVDRLRQPVKRLTCIEHRGQIGQQELHLRDGIGGGGLHRRSLQEIRPSWPVFLQTNQAYTMPIFMANNTMSHF
jgi:hypothetical protein